MAKSRRSAPPPVRTNVWRWIQYPRAHQWLLGSVLVAGVGARVWLALNDDGIYWPDEIYQSLEPAHRLVFGYGLISWEYGLGARGWTFPGLVSAILAVCKTLGLTDPRGYLTVVRFAMIAAAAGTVWASYRLAVRLGALPVFAAAGAAFFALAGPAIYFGPKALSEPASALPLVLGLAYALPPAASRPERLLGAALLGLGTLIRFHNAIFCLALVFVWLARRGWRQTAEVTVVLGLAAVVLGGLDWLTFGEWFQSIRLYVKFTLDGGGPVTGGSPASYYASMLFESMPLAFATTAVLAVAGVRVSPALGAVVLIFLLAHSLTPNKAYRYVLAGLPMIGALAALGLQWCWSRQLRHLALAGVGALLLGSVVSFVSFRALTFGDIGPYELTRTNESAYDDVGPVNRLMTIAGRQPDLCGLRVETHHLVWIGGYSYFHRQAPLYSPEGPPRTLGFYNYVIVPVADTVGNPVALDGDFALRRLTNTTCQPAPDYDWHLPGFEEMRRDLGR
jgi:phosphatidylinositol glycan class B